MAGMEELQTDFEGLLLTGDQGAAVSWVRAKLQEKINPLDFFQQVFTPAMKAIGDKFGRLDIFLPELMNAADAAKAVADQVIKPELSAQGNANLMSNGKVIIGSAKGDLHDIGKNMVSIMLQVNGFEVLDIGIDVPPRKFVDRAVEAGAQIVGVSSLMTTSMPYMREVIEMRDGLGFKEKFAVIVGGAPITPGYAESIGADGFGRDAVEAVNTCLTVMKARSKKTKGEVHP
jgi:methylmalonyl-CoA mutase cobalamin-binding domain/chain